MRHAANRLYGLAIEAAEVLKGLGQCDLADRISVDAKRALDDHEAAEKQRAEAIERLVEVAVGATGEIAAEVREIDRKDSDASR